MKTIYDIINETKNVDKVYKVVSLDGSIQSVWPNKNDADAECNKVNKKIDGKCFNVETDYTEEMIKD